MDCKKCGSVMFIDTWNGWVWTCINCDTTGRGATNKEIEEQEKEYNQANSADRKSSAADQRRYLFGKGT